LFPLPDPQNACASVSSRPAVSPINSQSLHAGQAQGHICPTQDLVGADFTGRPFNESYRPQWPSPFQQIDDDRVRPAVAVDVVDRDRHGSEF